MYILLTLLDVPGAQLERQTKPNKDRMQRSLSEKVQNGNYVLNLRNFYYNVNCQVLLIRFLFFVYVCCFYYNVRLFYMHIYMYILYLRCLL